MGPGAPGGAKEVLATRHGGYLLQIPPDSVDVHQYDRLTREGQTAFESGDDEVSAARFREALGLWEGPALVDVRLGPVLEIEVVRLEESRLVTVERRIDADLRLGRHAELIAELIELTARHPQHEGLHSQAMVALYRSGKQALRPGGLPQAAGPADRGPGRGTLPQLQRLHQAVLTVDPQLDVLAGPRHSSTYDLFTA